MLLLQACAAGPHRYALVDQHLLAGDPLAAAEVIERAKDDYGSKSRVLYDMDLGMALHLAGEFEASTIHLEQAERRIEDLYTRRVSAEVGAFLLNDTSLPFEGAPFEQIWINVLKALNYARLGRWDDALVESRRLDHHLNVLADRVGDDHEYRDDPFARYLSGMLYESAGDINNAFIAYRKAYDMYRDAQPWLRTPVPEMLRRDLLRVTDALHLQHEHDGYRREFGGVSWRPWSEVKDLAQVIVISYNGRAPRKEDQFLDLPISLDALELVLLTKAATGGKHSSDRRVMESVLYGLNGRVVRVALPKLVPQKTHVSYSEVILSGPNATVQTRTELAANLTATAEQVLQERFGAAAVKAVSRAAMKFALAEGAQRGAREAGGKDHAALLSFLVGFLTKTLAVATEEADKRSWRTLPDEIHVTRLWVPPGRYTLQIRPVTGSAPGSNRVSTHRLTLEQGQARFILERVMS